MNNRGIWWKVGVGTIVASKGEHSETVSVKGCIYGGVQGMWKHHSRVLDVAGTGEFSNP